MLRVTTFNANGIRSAARKGFFTWLLSESPDVLCMQETKAQEHQLPPEALELEHYPASAFVDAEKKGYSGVAIYAKRPPDRIVRGLGMPDMDAEGRFVRFDWGRLSTATRAATPGGRNSQATSSAIKVGASITSSSRRISLRSCDARGSIATSVFPITPRSRSTTSSDYEARRMEKDAL